MTTLYDEQLWLKHAEQARALSTVITDRRTKEHVLAIAAGFEHIAGLAKELKSAKPVYVRTYRLTRPVLAA